MNVLADHTRTINTAITQMDQYLITILDRHWISECVYGSVYRQGCSYGSHSVDFHNQIMQTGGKYILCIPEKNTQIQRHKELSKTRSEMFADITGVVNAYWDLWHGKEPEHGYDAETLAIQNHVDYLTAIGGVHNMNYFYRWNYEQHDAHFGEFIQDVIQGENNESTMATNG
jgi:hypothetical protein